MRRAGAPVQPDYTPAGPTCLKEAQGRANRPRFVCGNCSTELERQQSLLDILDSEHAQAEWRAPVLGAENQLFRSRFTCDRGPPIMGGGKNMSLARLA